MLASVGLKKAILRVRDLGTDPKGADVEQDPGLPCEMTGHLSALGPLTMVPASLTHLSCCTSRNRLSFAWLAHGMHLIVALLA